MPWEYLATPLFDGRLLPIVEAVQPFAEGARVLDLNCGPGRMAALLTGYASYYGNDTYQPFIDLARAQGMPNATFECLPDERVDRPCDVMLYLGVGCGEFTGEPLESQTGIASFKRLLRYEPRVVAVEMVRWWQERFRAADMIREMLAGYPEIASGEVNLPGVEFWHKRQWAVYAK